jgi:hypothetical protein
MSAGRRAALGVFAVFAASSAWLAAAYSARIRDWGVMTDELQYVKLALAAADTHSPLPSLHGQLVGSLNQLYPLVLAPLVGVFDAPDAFHAAHVLNAPLMASAAIPAYLLAREVVDRAAALAVAALSVVAVWMVLTGFLLTEVVAYPVFLWAVLAIQRAVRAPSWRRDLVALAAVAVAILARTQFVLLAVVLPLAVLGQALGLRTAPAEVGRRHRLLVGVYAAGVVAVAVLAIVGSTASLLGDYSVTATHGSLLPGGIWQSAAAHLDSMAIGCGLLPFVLGGGWALSALRRPPSPAAQAFAIVTVLAAVLLAFESASFDIRFGGRDVVRDRYVFYVVPLLLAGTAALLRGGRKPWLASAALAVFFAATVHWLELPPVQGLWVDSPTRILNDLIANEAGGTSPQAFAAWAGLLLAVCALLALRFVRAAVLAPVLFALLLAFSVFETQRAIDHTLTSASPSGRGMSARPSVTLDWVDSVLPHGAEVAIVPFPTGPSFASDADLWWDTEFWNRTVERAYVDGEDFRYTPFPTRRLEPDWETGSIPETAGAAPYVVAAASDPRFRLVADRLGANYGLDILAPSRPYRVAWMTRGLQPDGWTAPGRPAVVRAFAPPHTAVALAVQLRAPTETPVRFRVGSAGGGLAASETKTVRVRLCTRSSNHADAALSSPTRVRMPAVQRTFAPVGTRLVGVRVTAIETRAGGRC